MTDNDELFKKLKKMKKAELLDLVTNMLVTDDDEAEPEPQPQQQEQRPQENDGTLPIQGGEERTASSRPRRRRRPATATGNDQRKPWESGGSGKRMCQSSSIQTGPRPNLFLEDPNLRKTFENDKEVREAKAFDDAVAKKVVPTERGVRESEYYEAECERCGKEDVVHASAFYEDSSYVCNACLRR